jgi:dihydrofolate reductase
MRRLVVVEFLSLDGVMQGLGSPEEDTDGGFVHGGWGAPYAEAIEPSLEPGGTTAYLFGRRTYEKMAAFWPSRPDTDAIAVHLNSTTKYVATRTLDRVGWPGSVVLDGDLAAAVAALKAGGDGAIAVLGSGVLVRQLLLLDLVDELRLFVHPVVLGAGKRLFGELPLPRRLRLLTSGSTRLGTLTATYAVTPA